jgi:hypothetical protein
MGPDFVQVFTDGHWGFGGNGTIGNVDLLPITVQNTPYPHGLGGAPPSNGASRVLYTLDRRYRHLQGKVALNDTATDDATPLTFRIKGDSREIWRSPPVKAKAAPVEFSIDISTVTHLELIVDCPGSNNGDHAVWLDPTLISDQSPVK